MKGLLRSRIIQFRKDKRGILRQEWKYQNWTSFQFCLIFCDIFVSLNYFHLICLNVTKTCFASEHFEHFKVVLWNCKDKETMNYARSFIILLKTNKCPNTSQVTPFLVGKILKVDDQEKFQCGVSEYHLCKLFDPSNGFEVIDFKIGNFWKIIS